MFQKLFTWLKSSFNFVWLVGLAVYFAVLAGQAMFRDYQSQKDATDLKNQLAAAIQTRDQLSGLVAYYKTNSYKEKELRRTMLLKFPDETVYALPESGVVKTVETAEVANRAQAQSLTTYPNGVAWFRYLTGQR